MQNGADGAVGVKYRKDIPNGSKVVFGKVTAALAVEEVGNDVTLDECLLLTPLTLGIQPHSLSLPMHLRTCKVSERRNVPDNLCVFLAILPLDRRHDERNTEFVPCVDPWAEQIP